MLGRGVLVLALVGACGRIGFDASPGTPLGAVNADPGDNFGYVVALSADGATLVVGAFGERSNGDPLDNSIPDAGAVYVYVRDGNSWRQQAYLKASNPGIGLDVGDSFGWALGLSGDGSVLAVGAPLEDSSSPGIDGDQSNDTVSAAGAVYMFRRSGETWTQEAYVKASNPRLSASFGNNIALSADGATLAVGAPLEPSSATGIDGDQNAGGAPDAGAVYVFRHDATWTQEAYVKASNTDSGDLFGNLTLSADGSTLAVGALGESSAATGVDGNQLDNSATYSGAVYVYTRSGTTWTQQAYLKGPVSDPGDVFGANLSLSGDGDTLAVSAGDASAVAGDPLDNSAPRAGAVVIFERAGATWQQTSYLKSSNPEEADSFGGGNGFYSGTLVLSGDGTTLVVSAGGEDSATDDPTDNTADAAGACYRFVRAGSSWTQTAYIKALAPVAGDSFGVGLAVTRDGRTLAVGAPGAAALTGSVTVFP